VRPWKRRLSDDERSVLLSELLLRHPELVAEAEEITSTLLVVEDDQELADEITAKLRALRASGPVSVDTGRGVVRGELEPVLLSHCRGPRCSRHVPGMTIVRDMDTPTLLAGGPGLSVGGAMVADSLIPLAAPMTGAEVRRRLSRAVGTRLTGPLKTPVLQWGPRESRLSGFSCRQDRSPTR